LLFPYHPEVGAAGAAVLCLHTPDNAYMHS
jgi:hypothetical protein